jgi:hypothetical protein
VETSRGELRIDGLVRDLGRYRIFDLLLDHFREGLRG